MPEPMEEDILQVVKYCTDLIDDKDLEKLDLILKYMKRCALWSPFCFACSHANVLDLTSQSVFRRIMQQSVESVWSMAFDFILDNVQVVVQQAYGSTLKIAWRQRRTVFLHALGQNPLTHNCPSPRPVTTLHYLPKQSQWPPETQITDLTQAEDDFFGIMKQQKTRRD